MHGLCLMSVRYAVLCAFLPDPLVLPVHCVSQQLYVQTSCLIQHGFQALVNLCQGPPFPWFWPFNEKRVYRTYWHIEFTRALYECRVCRISDLVSLEMYMRVCTVHALSQETGIYKDDHALFAVVRIGPTQPQPQSCRRLTQRECPLPLYIPLR